MTGGSPSEVADTIVADLRELGGMDGMLSRSVNESVDMRQGRVIVEEATFHDEFAFQEFHGDAKHAAVAQRLSDVADWLVGDYAAGLEEPPSVG